MQYFLEPFTGADNTLLTAAGFDRVYPTGTIDTALEAKIGSNKGIGGGSASEKIYKVRANTNGARDFKTSVVLDWDNAAGFAGSGGLGVRVTDDGKEGYYAVIDSAAGLPVVYLYRRYVGVFTSLAGSPVSIDPFGATALNAGVELEIAVQTKADSVRLRVSVGGTVFIDYEDDSDNRIESSGGIALYFGSTLVLDDISFDDLQASDFEDEATGGDALTEGLVVVVNGVHYAEFEWQGLGIDPVWCVQSYQPSGSIALLMDLSPAESPALRAGDHITLIHEGDFHGDGVLRKVDQDFQPPEGIMYEVVGARDLAAEVPLEDPETGAGVIAFNQEEDSELFHLGRGNATSGANLEIGEIIKFVLVHSIEGDDGLRVRGAAPASGVAYVQAELDALDAAIPHITISGNVMQAVETLLGYMPEFACFIDPETKIHHFHKRSTSAFKTVNLTGDEGHVLPKITTDPSKNRTVVIVRGVKRESESTPFVWSDADPTDPTGLQRDWELGLEETVAENKKYVKEHGTTILGAGTDGTNIYVDLDMTDLTLAVNEWRGSFLFFSTGHQHGRSYQIRSNTAGGRVVLAVALWVGADPVAGDSVILKSGEDDGGLANGYDDVATAWRLPDGFEFAGGLCGDATVTKRVGSGSSVRAVSYKVKLRKQTYTNPDNGQKVTRFKMERPAYPMLDPEKDLTVGSIEFNRGPCDSALIAGDLALPSEVEVTLNVYNPAATAVPRVRLPAKGWEGSAFSFDPTKYGTGRGPGVGDVGVQLPHVIEDGNFTDLTLQGAEFIKYAQSVLNVLGTLAREGSYTVSGIDSTYAGLNKRIRFTDDTRTTGFEEATDLWIMQVQWDYKADETRVSMGSMSSGNVNLDVFRQAFAEKTRLDLQKIVKKKIEELAACLDPSIHGGTGAIGAEGPVAISDCKITTTYDYGTKKVTKTGRDVAQKVLKCTTPTPPTPTCNAPFLCSVHNPEEWMRNTLGLRNVTIKLSQPANFDASRDGNGVAGEPRSMGILDYVCCLADHVMGIESFLAGWGKAVDENFHAAQNDVTALANLIKQLCVCVNTETQKIKTIIPAYARAVCACTDYAPQVCASTCKEPVPVLCPGAGPV